MNAQMVARLYELWPLLEGTDQSYSFLLTPSFTAYLILTQSFLKTPPFPISPQGLQPAPLPIPLALAFLLVSFLRPLQTSVNGNIVRSAS